METIDPLPHAPIAEKSILSAMFRNPSNIAKAAAEGITSDAFHIHAHREILAALARHRDAGNITEDGEIDISVFTQSAHMDGILDIMGGASGIYSVASFAISMAGWSAWCDQLRECKARRIALEASRAIAEAVDSQEAIQTAKDTLEALQAAITSKTRAIAAKQAASDFIDKFTENYEHGEIPGHTTGIGEIDEVTGGMKPGELWTIGGQSSAGKSVLMFQIASEFIAAGSVVVVFSLELMTHEVTGRLVTLLGRVPYGSITNPRQANRHELDKIKEAVHRMGETRMWIDTSSNQTLDTISAEAQRILDIEGQIDLVVVDYIQICGVDRVKNEMREREIARISGGLKQLAKKLCCPVVTGSQLNEANKTRESRAIEQDSDTLILIENDGLRMHKNRNGRRSDLLPLALDGSMQRFRYFRRD